MSDMFCFQCEQTVQGKGCTKKGVCGKEYTTSNLQDKLIEKLMALCVATKGNLTKEVSDLIDDALFVTVTNVNFNDSDIEKWCDKVDALRKKFTEVPEKQLLNVWEGNEDIRSLKSLILFGIKGVSAYAHHARMLGFEEKSVNEFFQKALITIYESEDMDELLKVTLETGTVNLTCMELLDRANTETYGNPEPTEVSTIIEKGPFIVVSGHDLHDLHLLLEQTKGKGINIYTHSEMLPAHGYPKLKAYPHLKGHYGTAWQNQQKEFIDIQGPVLFTTNCIMPVQENYSDKIFTTSVVSYPNMRHVDEKKDFTDLINKALELGGNKEEVRMTGINGGTVLTTGFGHNTVLSHAGTIVEAVKKGDIKHFFLVGGCDGAKTGRNYYTDFVKQTPDDTIILTLACGKFRFNDLNLGTIGGLPRILDMGQCNDAYSAIKVAVALAEAFDCGVNDLPLSMILSWYEQKAVCILLTLLSLGIKDIRLGPTLPAFVSENVLNILIENYNIAKITTPEEDLKAILG